METEWYDSKKYQLISLVEEMEFLYNPFDQDYKNRKKRIAGIQHIADTMGFPTIEIEKKWKILRGQFAEEIKKLQTASPPVENIEENSCRWKYFKPMFFLKEFINIQRCLPQVTNRTMEPDQVADDSHYSPNSAEIPGDQDTMSGQDDSAFMSLCKSEPYAIFPKPARKSSKRKTDEPTSSSTVDSYFTAKLRRMSDSSNDDSIDLEIASFTKTMMAKLSKIKSDKIRRRVMKEIYDILYEAEIEDEMEQLDDKSIVIQYNNV